MPVWRGQKDECVGCCCLFLHHTLNGIWGRKMRFATLNVECVSCIQSPRRSGATVICLCSMLMSCYISEQRWKRLIDCDAAINYSCNRSVLDSNPSADRRRWVFKGCRCPCVFFPHCGNAFIPTLAFPFVFCTCAISPHHPTPWCPTYPTPPCFILSSCPWTDAFVLLWHQSERIKAPVVHFSCGRPLPPNRLDDVCFCPVSWE